MCQNGLTEKPRNLQNTSLARAICLNAYITAWFSVYSLKDIYHSKLQADGIWFYDVNGTRTAQKPRNILAYSRAKPVGFVSSNGTWPLFAVVYKDYFTWGCTSRCLSESNQSRDVAKLIILVYANYFFYSNE